MRTCDWIAVAYFLYLVAAAVARRCGSVAARALLAGAVVLLVALAPDAQPWANVHDWAPGVYLLLGYWLPAGLVGGVNMRFERWLQTFDQRMFGGRFDDHIASLPRALGAALEGAYLFCYPLVPLGFARVWIAGDSHDVDRYWTAVLLAGFGCYGMLPWLPTRAPRVVRTDEQQRARLPDAEGGMLRRANHWLLVRASVQWNTFPSGHVATAAAIALALVARFPAEGVLFLAIAIGITAGSVAGRYHYAADAIAGVAVGVVAFLMSGYIVRSGLA